MNTADTTKLTLITSTHQTFQSTETKGSSKGNGKYSSSVDPQVANSDEERQEGTISNTATKPYSTPVDAADNLTKPNKEIDQKNSGFQEADTSASTTAKANNSELFSTMSPQEERNMEDTAQGLYTEEFVATLDCTKSTDPSGDEIPKSAVGSIVSGDEDENHNATNTKQQHHYHQHPKEEDPVAITSEVQEQAAMQVMESPPHPSMVTVLWVHPQSPLVSISVV